MIDLHCHSYFSDGALSPEELVQKAQNHQIKCLSLTDHDTVAGYVALNQAALHTGIKIVNGIEFSTRWKKYDIHILGYQINHTNELNHLITHQNNSRVARAEQIGASLQLVGVDNAYEKACQLAGHKRVGRPHFAQILINEGKTRDMKSAFKQFLGRGKTAYIPTPWISIQEAVKGITDSGGQAVIAHPLKYGLTRSKLHELINEFKDAGGEGMEVVSGEMNVTQIKEMAATCLRFNLLASSGSDFHSDALSRINLGRQQQLPVNCTPIWQEWNI
ncbi:PHP domain-containing protein [Legionella bononiensis]|uniref:PHP domain-containing protein n=1 Tax=Legionella bononiensis TaxID=2793102 RepID=A0ABS1W7J2_9GAMM|nr:PHP domain-containing protein [Legionella bononiensis]MBL7480154.1 PHP domain-containing protein [Legionella bononiensis]MBL7525331.1 PHP domain-containing protein [Legionella bononiensis]MBL7561515.1 PHP domain-containing protein [Legionella bononiensis]